MEYVEPAGDVAAFDRQHISGESPSETRNWMVQKIMDNGAAIKNYMDAHPNVRKFTIYSAILLAVVGVIVSMPYLEKGYEFVMSLLRPPGSEKWIGALMLIAIPYNFYFNEVIG